MRWVQVPGGKRRPRWVGHLISVRRSIRALWVLSIGFALYGVWLLQRDVRADRHWAWWAFDAVFIGWGVRLIVKTKRAVDEHEAERWEAASQQADPITALACWDVMDKASYTAISDAVEWVSERDGETWVGTTEELNAMLAEAPRLVQAVVLAGIPPHECSPD